MSGFGSTVPRQYTKGHIRLISGSPSAQAPPPDLLAAIDRSKYRGGSSDSSSLALKQPTRTQKSRGSASVVQQPKWRPKTFERLHSSQSELTGRHWDTGPAGIAEEEEEPEWASDPVTYTENFDFSHATLDRDKPAEKPAVVDNEPIAVVDSEPIAVSGRSRFGFAIGEVNHDQHPVTNGVSLSPSRVHGSPSRLSRQSRFWFAESGVDASPSAVEPFGSRFGAHVKRDEITSSPSLSVLSSSQAHEQLQQERRQQQPQELFHNHQQQQLHYYRQQQQLRYPERQQQIPAASTLERPKGVAVNVSDMFQMYSSGRDHHQQPSDALSRPHLDQHHHRPMPIPNRPMIMQNRSLTISGLSSAPATSLPTSSEPHRRRSQEEPQQQQRPQRPRPIVPAQTAPPAYVRSYMNMQLETRAPSTALYAPPGLNTPPNHHHHHRPAAYR